MATEIGPIEREGTSSVVQSAVLPPRGRFYVFEGIDGSGKTTVAKRVYESLLTGIGREVVLTAEPTDTWLGDNVRRAHVEDVGPLTEALLFVADRAAHTERIRRWLESGKIVLSDRYFASTLAYQGAMLLPFLGRGAIDWLRAVNEPAVMRPDLTFFLAVPPATGMERLSGRNERTKFEKLEFLNEVDRIYRKLAEEDDSFITVDATRSLDDVVSEILNLIKDNI